MLLFRYRNAWKRTVSRRTADTHCEQNWSVMRILEGR